MSDLTDFLLARIAERQASARRRQPKPGVTVEWWNDWRVPKGHVGVGNPSLGKVITQEEWDEKFEEVDPDPVVLAECAALRRIVELHTDGQPWCSWAWDGTVHGEPGYEECDNLRALASMFAHHPDFRPEWRLT